MRVDSEIGRPERQPAVILAVAGDHFEGIELRLLAVLMERGEVEDEVFSLACCNRSDISLSENGLPGTSRCTQLYPHIAQSYPLVPVGGPFLINPKHRNESALLTNSRTTSFPMIRGSVHSVPVFVRELKFVSQVFLIATTHDEVG